MDWAGLANVISDATAQPFTFQNHSTVGGGCINTAYRIASNNKSYFVKFNRSDRLNMFEAESDGLIELAKADAVLVPLPVCTGVLEQSSFIVMDDLTLSSAGSMSAFARQLIKLHRYNPPTDSSQTFGWSRDNTIGSTLQVNTQSDNWITFWNTQRLGYQLTLAKERGASQSLLDKAERIQADIKIFFHGYQPLASLLHGDLWSGNFAFTQSGEPVIFDPAIYYGDREADIAMTELFGGFSRDFYEEYNRIWPLDDNYRIRKDLYNLYHILNHFNMFGGSYGSQAEQICGRLLAKIR